MCYSFSSCSSLPCISLLLLKITHGSGGGCGYARMRGITPARPQFETRPLLLDVTEVPRPLNKTGLYSREAYFLYLFSVEYRCPGNGIYWGACAYDSYGTIERSKDNDRTCRRKEQEEQAWLTLVRLPKFHKTKQAIRWQPRRRRVRGVEPRHTLVVVGRDL